MTETKSKAINVGAREFLRRWYGEHLEERVSVEEGVSAARLAYEAAGALMERYDADRTLLREEAPYVLRAFAHGMALEALRKTRFGWLVEGQAGGLDAWMEHSGGRHLPLSEMEADDLVASADAREKRARTELRIARTFRDWAGGLEPGQKVGQRVSKNSSARPVVYMAGKVGGSGDWRCRVLEAHEPTSARDHEGKTVDSYDYGHYKNYSLPVLHGGVFDRHLHPYTGPGTWPRIDFAAGFSYAGPYYRDMWGGHGVDNEETNLDHAGDLDYLDHARRHQIEAEVQPALRGACLSAIRESTHVFLWLDDPHAYGTMVEIGYAHALGKPIYAAVGEAFAELPSPSARPGSERTMGEEFWFALSCAERVDDVGGDPEEAFATFLLWAGLPLLAGA